MVYKTSVQAAIAEFLENQPAAPVLTEAGGAATNVGKWCRGFRILYEPCQRSCTKIPCGVLFAEWEVRCRPSAPADMEDVDM